MRPERPSRRRIAVIGAALVALGPMSMALYTPAMPTLVDAFATDEATIKLTLTAYFGGFALFQLLYGPLSDAFGRKPVALAAVALYLAASLVAALAPSIAWMLAGRLLQGVGASAGIAISRAIVRDLYTGQASARIMNTMALMLGLGPAIAPTVGGLLLAALGWQSIFAGMVLYGAGLGALILLALPETLAEPDPARARPGRLAAAYAALIGDKRFLRPSLIMGLTLGAIYTLAAILPFVMIDEVGFSPTAFGVSMMMQTGSFMVGSLVVGRLMRRIDARHLVPVGLGFVAAGGLAFAAGLRLLEPSFATVMGPVAIWAFGVAFIMPYTQTAALAPFPRTAGSASALMGFLQMGGGLLGTAVAALFDEPVAALASVVPAMAAGAVLTQILVKGSPDETALPLHEEKRPAQVAE